MSTENERYICCECDWTGTLKEQRKVEDDFAGVKSFLYVCPECANDEFYLEDK